MGSAFDRTDGECAPSLFAHPVSFLSTPSSHLYLSVPHHPRQPIQSHTLVPFRLTSSSSTPSHIPFYLSVPHHPRQPLQSHALVPFRPTSSSSTLQSHALLPFRPTSSPSTPPVTRPCAFPSHIIPVSPSSHMPFYLSVPHHPRQPLQSHALLPFHFIQHFVPPLRFFSPCPRPSGKVPGFSAKTVHFPLWPTRIPAPQASLAAPAISTPGESAGFFGENGSLSPAADRGTGSTGISRRTWHFRPRGKCREFPRKRFTFPRGSQGHRLHRPLSRHLPFPLPGKVPGFPAKTVHFHPRPTRVPAPQASLAALGISTPGESDGNFRENGSLSPVA